MPVIKAQVVLDRRSNLAKDKVVNNFAFGVASGYSTATLEAIRDAVRAFYDTTYAATGKLGSFLSQELVTSSPISDGTGTRTVKLYDLSQSTPRVPVLQDVDHPVLGQSSQANLPAECAVVLSFQAAKVSGQSQARRRGRIYLGPLNAHAGQGVTNFLVHPDLITIGMAAMADLASRSAAATAWTWGVYSEKFHTFAPVHDVWMDDAFDTQRRRGSQPTLRNAAVANAANAVVLGA